MESLYMQSIKKYNTVKKKFTIFVVISNKQKKEKVVK